MPKKQALEAIARFEITYGGGSATAHDVFFAIKKNRTLISSNTF
jgi:hypothetical protein